MTATAIQLGDLSSSFTKWREKQTAHSEFNLNRSTIDRLLKAQFAMETARTITLQVIEIGLMVESDSPSFAPFYYANTRVQTAWSNLKNSVIPVSKEPYDKVLFLLEDLATPHPVEWDMSHLDDGRTMSETTKPYTAVLDFLKS